MKAVNKGFIGDEAGLELLVYVTILGLNVAGTLPVLVAIGNSVVGQYTAVQSTSSAQMVRMFYGE